MAIYVNGIKVAGGSRGGSGTASAGIPVGGMAGQVLAKKTAVDYDTHWTDPPEGGGSNGATFMPSVSEAGVISWTNDKGLPNPEPVNIKGPPGEGGGSTTGVSSFNGRTGAVTPQAGDYTAVMVGARASDWMPTAADVGALATGSVAKIELLTETDYNALEVKDAGTLYLIEG